MVLSVRRIPIICPYCGKEESISINTDASSWIKFCGGCGSEYAFSLSVQAYPIKFRQCEHCGGKFVPSDRRQKYCPPPPGKKISPCMNRAKQKAFKERNSREAG